MPDDVIVLYHQTGSSDRRNSVRDDQLMLTLKQLRPTEFFTGREIPMLPYQMVRIKNFLFVDLNAQFIHQGGDRRTGTDEQYEIPDIHVQKAFSELKSDLSSAQVMIIQRFLVEHKSHFKRPPEDHS